MVKKSETTNEMVVKAARNIIGHSHMLVEADGCWELEVACAGSNSLQFQALADLDMPDLMIAAIGRH